MVLARQNKTTRDNYANTWIDDLLMKFMTDADWRDNYNLAGWIYWGEQMEEDKKYDMYHNVGHMHEQYDTWKSWDKKRTWEETQVEFLCKSFVESYHNDRQEEIKKTMIANALTWGRKTKSISFVLPLIEAYVKEFGESEWAFQSEE